MYNKYNKLANKLKFHYTRNIPIFYHPSIYFFHICIFFGHTNYLPFIASVDIYLFWLKSLKEFHLAKVIVGSANHVAQKNYSC